MSIFSEFKHGQVSREEFLSVCNQEDAKDRYYMGHRFDEIEDEEDEDENNQGKSNCPE